MAGTQILLSNPPGRNRKGQFTKGRRKSTRRKTRRRTTARRTTAARTTARRRRVSSNPPARRRRRRSSATLGRTAFKLKELLPQSAAVVGGFYIADRGTALLIDNLPAEVTQKVPGWAGPIVKGGVVLLAAHAMRSKMAPRALQKFAVPVAIGGLASAGMDAWRMAAPRFGLSGYELPPAPQLSPARPQLMGYNDPRATRRAVSGQVVDHY